MKNAYLRNMMISVTMHLACVYVLIAFSLGSCHSRRPPKDLAFFVDFQPGPPPAPAQASVSMKAGDEPVSPEPVDAPESIPEPPKRETTTPKKITTENVRKPKIEISTNLVRRATTGARRPAKQLSATEIRKMLGSAVEKVGASSAGASASAGVPAGVYGTGSGPGEATPYGWYLAQVRAIMYDAWQQPSLSAARRGLVTRILIRVRQDGQIVQKKMDDSSGNELMDATVMKAVESVESLPALPFGFGGDYKDITIDFELEDTGP